MFININSKYHQRMYALKIVRFSEKKKHEPRRTALKRRSCTIKLPYLTKL